MRNLLLLIFLASFVSCQNPKIQTLEAENAALSKFLEEEAINARQAEALAMLAHEDAEIAAAQAVAAEEKTQRVMEKLKACEAGK